MRQLRQHLVFVLCLYALGLLCLAGCGSGGFLHNLNPLAWFEPPAPNPTDAENDPTGLVAIFGKLSWGFIGIGAIGTFIAVVAAILGGFGKALKWGSVAAIAVAFGFGFGLVKGAVNTHPVLCGLGFAAGLAALFVPHLLAKPVHTAVTKLKSKGKPNVERPPPAGDAGRAGLPTAHQTGDQPHPSRAWTDEPPTT